MPSDRQQKAKGKRSRSRTVSREPDTMPLTLADHRDSSGQSSSNTTDDSTKSTRVARATAKPKKTPKTRAPPRHAPGGAKNTGKPWDHEACAQLIEGRQNGLTHKEVAIILGRSDQACRLTIMYLLKARLDVASWHRYKARQDCHWRKEDATDADKAEAAEFRARESRATAHAAPEPDKLPEREAFTEPRLSVDHLARRPTGSSASATPQSSTSQVATHAPAETARSSHSGLPFSEASGTPSASTREPPFSPRSRPVDDSGMYMLVEAAISRDRQRNPRPAFQSVAWDTAQPREPTVHAGGPDSAMPTPDQHKPSSGSDRSSTSWPSLGLPRTSSNWSIGEVNNRLSSIDDLFPGFRDLSGARLDSQAMDHYRRDSDFREVLRISQDHVARWGSSSSPAAAFTQRSSDSAMEVDIERPGRVPIGFYERTLPSLHGRSDAHRPRPVSPTDRFVPTDSPRWSVSVPPVRHAQPAPSAPSAPPAAPAPSAPLARPTYQSSIDEWDQYLDAERARRTRRDDDESHHSRR